MELYSQEHSYDDEQQADTEEDVVIKVERLEVWTPEEKSWWRRQATKHKTVLLSQISGCIRRNEFAAVIGPSGAGKTTFLVSLAGKCVLPSSGTVTLLGRNVKECPGLAEIVPQHEVFMAGLSVMEHLVFMTEMKLGSCKAERHLKRLNTLIEELKLKSHVHTPISVLSGGEKKLLSLATALLSDPIILICDEPTSGLDSYSAALVVGVLKKLSLSGKVVLCSIHQPSCDIFKEFSSILLMAEGRLLFHGTQDQCEQVFKSLQELCCLNSIDLHCPMNYNPAEFYIRAVSGSSDAIQKLLELSEGRIMPCDTAVVSYKDPVYCKTLQRNWCKQVLLLLWRLSLTLKSGIWDQIIQLFICVVITAIVLSVVYAGATGTTQRGVQDIRGLLWLLTSEVCFGISYFALYAFECDLALFKREVGIYKCSAYFVSRFLGFIPRCIVWPVTLVAMTTLAVELPNHATTVLELMGVLIISTIASAAYGLGMAALFTSTGTMDDVMPTVDLPLFLVSGAVLRISSLPTWLYPVKYMSHFYYTLDALSNVYWRQIEHIDCPWNETTTCVRDGAAVLIEDGYSEDFILQDTLGISFVALFWSLLGYYGLKREEKKGYAY